MKTSIALFLALFASSFGAAQAFAQAAPASPSQDSEQGFDQEALDAKVAEILPRVEELRGWKFDHSVPAGVNTPDEFLEFASAEYESEYGAEKMKAITDAYIMFGLFDEGQDLLEVSMELLRGQVGGYYDPKTKKFYMMSTFNQGGLADIIMAHELTHALDDQRFHLDEMFAEAMDLNDDAVFALRAVVEGSGTSLMNLYTMQGMLAGYLKMEPAEMMEMMEGASESLEGAPPFLIMTMALPYLEGNKFLVKQSSILAAATMTPKNDDLDQAFNNPPVSSEQVLHPEKYWDADKLDLPVEIKHPDYLAVLPGVQTNYTALGGGVIFAIILMLVLIRKNPSLAGLACASSLIIAVIQARGDSWEIMEQNTLGEIGCFILTADELPNMATAEGQMATMTNEAASGWGGDSYTLLKAPNGGQLMVWATVWDSPEDCGEFSSEFHMMNDENKFMVNVDEYESAVVVAYADELAAEYAELVCQKLATANNF